MIKKPAIAGFFICTGLICSGLRNFRLPISKILENAGFRVRLFLFRARRDDAHGRSLQGGATLLWMKTDV